MSDTEDGTCRKTQVGLTWCGQPGEGMCRENNVKYKEDDERVADGRITAQIGLVPS